MNRPAIPQKKVTSGELLDRIQRKLRGEDQVIRRCHPNNPEYYQLGNFYVWDVQRNRVLDNWVNLETKAKALGVLGAGERIARES